MRRPRRAVHARPRAVATLPDSIEGIELDRQFVGLGDFRQQAGDIARQLPEIPRGSPLAGERQVRNMRWSRSHSQQRLDGEALVHGVWRPAGPNPGQGLARGGFAMSSSAVEGFRTKGPDPAPPCLAVGACGHSPRQPAAPQPARIARRAPDPSQGSAKAVSRNPVRLAPHKL